MQTHLEDLPNEILRKITNNLNSKLDVLNFSNSCKNTKKLRYNFQLIPQLIYNYIYYSGENYNSSSSIVKKLTLIEYLKEIKDILDCITSIEFNHLKKYKYSLYSIKSYSYLNIRNTNNLIYKLKNNQKVNFMDINNMQLIDTTNNVYLRDKSFLYRYKYIIGYKRLEECINNIILERYIK